VNAAVLRPSAANPADRLIVIASAVLLTAVISAMLLIAPVVVGALITQKGFTPSQGGLTIAIELGAMSAAALPALWWLPRWPWPRLLLVALLVMIAGDVACMHAASFAALATLRCLTGLAGGSIMCICLAVIGMSSQTERNFGWWTIGQLLLGAVGLAVLPRVLPSIGLQGLYLALAALLGVCLLAARVLPQPAAPSAGTTRRGGAPSAPALIGLAGVFCLYVGLGGLWTYVERIGITAGLAPALIGDDLTIASLCGVAGCATAILIGGRFGRINPLLLGFGLVVGGAAGLLGMPSAVRYLLAAACFKYAWTFALPFVLAGMNSHDRSGRLMALTNLMIGGGLAVGPAVIAAALSSPPNYGIAPVLAIAFGATSLGLLLWSMRRSPAA
jgi:predicted MFS family arabinose efflux permease